MSFRLGHHVFTTYGFKTCAKHAATNDAKVIQIFLNPPQSFKTTTDKDDVAFLCKDAKNRDIKILVHGNYMLNFCNPPESNIYKNACRVLISELNSSVELNAIGVVVHMGKNVKKLNISDEAAIDNYVSGLAHCLDSSNSKSVIVLETGAGQGTEMCTDLVSLGKLKDRLKRYGDRVKFCIDTCHIFAAGYDISDPDYVKVLDKHIDNTLGWNNVVAVHLNDSKTPLGSRKDRHADIGTGYIDFRGLMEFVKICKNRCIPTVLETPAEKYRFTQQMSAIVNYIEDGTVADYITNIKKDHDTFDLQNIHPL